MSLKDRLNRLTGEAHAPFTTHTRQEKIEELHKKLDRFMDRSRQSTSAPIGSTRPHIVPLEDLITGKEVETPHGKFFISQSIMKAGEIHGHARICDVACVSMEAAALVTGIGAVQDMSLTDGLFLDTETTGLAGGTGTFPFLIGLGWFEENLFVTCQLFARDFSEEGPLLRYLSDFASRKRFLVTFNGRAFDLNLLAARFILNRCPDSLSPLPHIDLLHPSRRMLAHRLENSRLSTIEAYILGVEREGDVPGFEIPERYFEWLRRRDGRLLADVFTHNRLDVVSMAALLKFLSDLVEDSHLMSRSHHGDLLKLAGLIHDKGDSEKAGRMFESLALSNHSEVAAHARKALSLIYKKARRWDDAAQIWQELLVLNPRDLFAGTEMAKYYEHRRREIDKALHLVEVILEEQVRLDYKERTSLERRLERLLRKMPSN